MKRALVENHFRGPKCNDIALDPRYKYSRLRFVVRYTKLSTDEVVASGCPGQFLEGCITADHDRCDCDCRRCWLKRTRRPKLIKKGRK